MKVKFLVPEIDRNRFSESLKYRMDWFKKSSKDLTNIGSESYTEQNIYKYKKGSIPSIDRFLTICRYLLTPPDEFLSPIPKWIECEINNNDILKFPLIGQIDDTYYVAPPKVYPWEILTNYKISSFEELPEEPSPESYRDFHLYVRREDSFVICDNDKYIYRFPRVDDEKTSKKIFEILENYNLSTKQLMILLGFSSPADITNRKAKIKNTSKGQSWTIKDIYKLSWILNKPFEEFLEFKPNEQEEETRNVPFDVVFYLEHIFGDESAEEDV